MASGASSMSAMMSKSASTPSRELRLITMTSASKLLFVLFGVAQVAHLRFADASAPGTWEGVDADFDIMALIDDAPEAISMLQRDSRLQGGSATCEGDCAAASSPATLATEERSPAVAPSEGVSLLQVKAKYKLKQHVE